MAKEELKELKNVIRYIQTNKKFQIGLTILIFLAILISSTNIRLSNLDKLVDQTTGKYSSNDLDSLYFYRIAETKIANGGILPAVDVLRAPARQVGWMTEILPDVMIALFKIEKIFSPSITFDYSAAISAPIIFAMILIAFFFLCFLITKSRVASLIASALLAFSPSFLFRSIAGFYDHDHLGVLVLILLLIAFLMSLKRFENSWKETIIWGLVVGFFTSLLLVSWGGAITFILVTIPLACLFYYLLNNKDSFKFLTFYFLWMLSSVLFLIVLNNPMSYMANRFLDSQGIIALFVLGFALIDTILIKYCKKYFKFIKEQYEKAYSLGITFVLGLIGLIIIGKNPIDLFKKAWATLIYPFFGEFSSRLEMTVAENAQPQLVDLIAQTGQVVFWLFLLGLILVGISFSSKLKNLKNKVYLSIASAIIFLAILCSRISSTNLLNGENFISQALYFTGVLIFFVSFAYVYSKEKFNVSVESILLFSLALTIVMNARAAVRSFFLITPFICLFAAYFIISLFNYSKQTKDETLKYILWTGTIVSILLVFISLFSNPFSSTDAGFYQIVSAQAQYVGSSANSQWQNAMAWARNSTNSNDLFIHWWDYGYFIQTLASRPTVTDGGHAGGGVSTDHFIGRYVLTTPNPITAFSLMKTWNVSYLLIDPTELGKYGAYSKIGGDINNDRYSAPSAVVADAKQTTETASGIKKIYTGSTFVDEDINYNGTFLPGPVYNEYGIASYKSYFLGIIMEYATANQTIQFKQPTGVFMYNNKQYQLPLRYIYLDGKIIDFKIGLNSTFIIIPSLIQSSTGSVSSDNLGAGIYLSKKVSEGLFAQLYLMNDVNKQYPTIKIAHSEDDDVVKALKAQGMNLGEFIYFNGLRSPLKIWKVEYPLGVATHREFLNLQEDIDSGIYYTLGEMDKYFN